MEEKVKNVVGGSGVVGGKSDEMNMWTDVYIPCTIVLGLFIVNAFVFMFILHKRRKVLYEDVQSREHGGGGGAAATDDNSCAIEMEHL